MQETGLIDVLMVLQYAVEQMRKMMDGNDECESFAVMLDGLGLLGCNTEEAMKGLMHIQIAADTPKPHPHIWNVVCIAACIFRMASFLREANPREVLIVDDTLFYKGATIRLPTLGEIRMIVIMGIYYHAVCKNMGIAGAAIDLYKSKNTCHLLHNVHPHVVSAFERLEKSAARQRILKAWIECNRNFCEKKASENFIGEFRTIDRLTGSMFAFVFAAGAVNIKKSSSLIAKGDDIINCLIYCLKNYKPPAGTVLRFHLHGTESDALFDLVSFNLQCLGKLNAMLQWIAGRAGEMPDVIQTRAAELLFSLKNSIQ